MLPSLSPRPGRGEQALHPCRRRAARAGAPRVPRRPARHSGGTPGEPKLGRWCCASPSGWVSTSTSPSTCARARRASAPWRSTAAPPSPAAAVAARWDDRSGLDLLAADDDRRLRQDPEPRRPAVGQGACRPHALDCDGGGRRGNHSRHVPASCDGFPECSWWTTAPTSPARCSVPSSRAGARAS